MNQPIRRTLWLPGLSLLCAFIMVGCGGTTPVEVLSVTGPDSLLTQESGTFEAQVNEDASEPISYTWNFTEADTAQGNPVTYSYDQAGTYDVTVTASNGDGEFTSTGEKTVIISNPPVPAEVVAINLGTQQPDTRTPVRFSANVRGDEPVQFNWNFGDGETATGSTVTHTYQEPGDYTVSLDVSNAEGQDAATQNITVSPYEAEYCGEITEMNAAFFDRNSSSLTSSARSSLQENLQILEDCPNMDVRVEGYAAPFERNPQQLSEDRARAVEQFYTEQGVEAQRLAVAGQGQVGGGAKKGGAEQFRRVDTVPGGGTMGMQGQ